jgi:tetratricopeptide (TPR) repeat protein
MKAEHRKELQTNALADRLGRFVKGLGSKPSSGGLAIAVIVLVAVAIFFAWRYFGSVSRHARSEMWVALDKITGEELAVNKKGFHQFAGGDDDYQKIIAKLEKISKDNAGTKASLMARFQIAQINLIQRGINMLTQPGTAATALKNLDQAEQDYEKLAKECRGDAAWEPQALLALAKIAKTRAVKDLKHLDTALELYQQLADKYGNTAAGMEAAREVKDLKDKDKKAAIADIYKEMGKDLRVYNPG